MLKTSWKFAGVLRRDTLQNRRGFFAFFRRAGANARRARSASHAPPVAPVLQASEEIERYHAGLQERFEVASLSKKSCREGQQKTHLQMCLQTDTPTTSPYKRTSISDDDASENFRTVLQHGQIQGFMENVNTRR